MMDSKTKIAVTVAAGLVVTLAMMFLVFRPLVTSVKGLNYSLAEKETELGELEQQIVEFKSAQTDLARATFKNDIYGTIVEREDLSLAIVDLEAAAEENGVEESLQISDPSSDAARRGAPAAPTLFESLALSKEVGYRMEVTGTFAGLVGFMQELENLPHFTEYSEIILAAEVENLPAAEGGSRNTGALNGTFDGVFLVKNNPDAATDAQPQ
jgi:hypothetical protein